jgi:hypothetical protein
MVLLGEPYSIKLEDKILTRARELKIDGKF